MTAYIFVPKSTTQFVNWADPTIWSTRVVPDSADAGVVFPTVTSMGSGLVYTSYVTIDFGSNYLIGSLDLSNNDVTADGSLAISGPIVIRSGGEINTETALSASSIENDGYLQGGGNINVSGRITNNSVFYGYFTVTAGSFVNNAGVADVSIDADSFTNNGSVGTSQNTSTIITPAGGLTNLAHGTLTGGVYQNVVLNVGDVVTVDAATIQDGMWFVDPVAGAQTPLQDTLRTIAPTGSLTLDSDYQTTALTVEGSLSIVAQPGVTPAFSADQLTVTAGGSVSGSGTITAPILNDGSLTADDLVINGQVSGAGPIVVAAGKEQLNENYYYSAPPTLYPTTLELNGAVSNDVIFDNNIAVLTLDQPAKYTGAIAPSGIGDQIILPGIALSSVTGYSYSGNSTGGTLTIQENGTSLALKFAGDYTTQNFVLSAGAQPLSSSPPTLEITEMPPDVAPVATAPSTAYNATELQSLSLKNTGLSVSDADGGTFIETATLSVGQGTLTASAGGSGATVTGDGTAALKITGTIAQIDAFLDTDPTSAIGYLDTTSAASTSTALTLTIADGTNVNGGLSSTATTPVDITVPPPVLTVQSLSRVSTGSEGEQGDGQSDDGVFSPDGTKVAFYSRASNLVPGDTNATWDIFVKDLASGALTRVSVDASGAQADQSSVSPVFSPDGTLIAFVSLADNLVPGVGDGTPEVYVKDLTTGAVTCVSTNVDGQAANGQSADQVFSPDGTLVAFDSFGSNLVPGVGGTVQIYVKNLVTGAVTCVSTDATGAPTEGQLPAFSPDGKEIAFQSESGIQVKNLETGALTTVSPRADGYSYSPRFSPDGSEVAFYSYGSNFTPGDTNQRADIFLENLATGALTRVPIDDGDANGDNNAQFAFSNDGKNIVFTSNSNTLVPGDTNNARDVFVYSIASGTIARVSETAAGEQGDGDSGLAMFSPDGSHIVFTSAADNLVPSDTNATDDIFVATLADKPVLTASVATSLTNRSEVDLSGTALDALAGAAGTAGMTVSVTDNGAATPVGAGLVLSDGSFTADVALAQGTNILVASSTNKTGSAGASAPVSVTRVDVTDATLQTVTALVGQNPAVAYEADQHSVTIATGTTLVIVNANADATTLGALTADESGALAPSNGQATVIANPTGSAVTILSETSSFLSIPGGSVTAVGGDAPTFIVDASHDTAPVTLLAGSGRSFLLGSQGSAVLNGSTSTSGSATLVAESSSSTLEGGLGSDRLFGASGATLTGGNGAGQILAGYNNGVGGETLTAGSGNMQILAVDSGTNLLDASRGGAGDVLWSGSGTDMLLGSSAGTSFVLGAGDVAQGTATAIGGTGNDTFVVNRGDAASYDRIIGGGGSDVAMFDGYSATDATVTNDTATNVTHVAFASGQTADISGHVTMLIGGNFFTSV